MHSTFKKMLSVTLLILPAAVSVFNIKAADFMDGIAAIVGDEVITVYEVVNVARPMEINLRERYDGEDFGAQLVRLRQQVARQMIEEELLFLEYKNQDIELPKDFIDKRINEIVVSRAGGSYDKFTDLLVEQGMTFDEFREQLTRQLAAQLMVDQFVRQRVRVTRNDVENYYQENKAKFGKPGRVKLRVIFLARKDENDESDGSIARARDVVRRLEAGADFAELAQELSDDPVSAARDGNLGWVDMNAGRKAFIDAVHSLEPGQVAPPIEQREGAYVLKLVEVKEEAVPALDKKLREEIRSHLEESRYNKRFQEYIDELREKYHVKTFYGE